MKSLIHPEAAFSLSRSQTSTTRWKPAVLFFLAFFALRLALPSALAQGTAFTYQGRLTENGSLANGLYDLGFRLYDAPAAGNLVGIGLGFAGQAVSNGLFTVELDFGTNVLTGPARWLQIEVKTDAASVWTELSPRQSLTPAPYAIHAYSVSGSNITGVVPNGHLPANLVRTDPGLVEMEADFIFRGSVEFQNASGPPFEVTGSQDMVLGLNAERLGNRTAGGFWQTEGNAGTTAGPQFLGTTDNQALEFKVEGLRALRLEPGGDSEYDGDTIPDGAPNVIGGAPNNRVASGVVGATISGGGATNMAGEMAANLVSADYATLGGGLINTIDRGATSATIAGGKGHTIQGYAPSATISGGGYNIIGTNAGSATIGGGWLNAIEAYSTRASISGGSGNTILTNSAHATIGGGEGNTVGNYAWNATIGGGGGNTIQAVATAATISGGSANTIGTNATESAIGGGLHNTIQTNAAYSTIGGGQDNELLGLHSVIAGGKTNRVSAAKATIGGGEYNTIAGVAYGAVIGGGAGNEIESYSEYAVIPGGFRNTVRGFFCFAGGYRAKALHEGAFVWADSTDADFASTSEDQFNIRATGGVRIDSGMSAGIALNLADRPLITRGHDPFTSGNYVGAGRWGVFMEPHTLVAGIPAIAGKSFRVSTYNADSTINQHLMTVDQAGTVTATAFNPASDRDAKENFTDINSLEMLDKVAALPISRWNFKKDTGNEHIGPMAQDFRAAFGLGTDDKHIATVDADGVALAAIQGLNQKLEATRAENAELRRELDSLRQMFETLTRKGDQ